MWMFESSEEYYTNLHSCLAELPTIPGHWIEVLAKWSGFTKSEGNQRKGEARVREALVYGGGPRVKVKELGPIRVDSPIGTEFGFTPENDTFHHIEISAALIRILEGIPHSSLFGADRHSTAPLAVAGRELVKFVKVTLLHELCHWGNVRTGVSFHEKDRSEIEVGWAFENEARVPRGIPPYFLKPHSIEDSPVQMRREPPPQS